LVLADDFVGSVVAVHVAVANDAVVERVCVHRWSHTPVVLMVKLLEEGVLV
jgi:hypothetical protein